MTFRHRAGVSPYTSSYDFAETCVFGKQSVEPLHCGPLAGAPLLPKLQDYFAEFLNPSSPVRLSILYSSTCVGLWYGRSVFSTCRVFLGPRCRSLLGFPPGVTVINRLPPPSTQGLTFPQAVLLSFPGWYRNIHRLSIAYACRPRLRPD